MLEKFRIQDTGNCIPDTELVFAGGAGFGVKKNQLSFF